MKKYIKFVLLFLSMIAMLNLTVFAINTQNVFDTGLNILDAVGLCAAGLFVISLVFILVGLFTEKKQKQPDTTPNIIENNINKSPAPIEQPQDEESQEEQPQDEQSQAEQSQDEQPQDEEQEVEESQDEEQEPEQPIEAPISEDTSENIKRTLVLNGLNNKDELFVAIDNVVTVGRKGNNDLVISDTVISGRHCEISCDKGDVFISDNNSTNGTYINTRKISEKTKINDGDILQLGERRYKVSIT